MKNRINTLIKRLTKRGILAIIIVLAIIGFFVVSANRQQPKNERTYTVAKQDLKETLAFSGVVDAQEKATLRFQMTGRMSWIGVKEGDFVKQYQTLASLDQRSVRKNLDKELNDYLKVRWDFDQTKDDNKTIINDRVKRIVDKAQFDLNNAVLDVELQNLTIEFSSIFSPIAGIVTKISAPYAGVNVTTTDTIEIVNPETVFFSGSVDQTDVSKLYGGQTGTITLDAYPDDSITATIETVSFSPKEDETGTVYEVKMQMPDNVDYKYKLGMTGDIEFVLRSRPGVLSVPPEFITSEGNKEYVFKKSGRKKEKIQVTTGERTDEFVEIKSGVSAGDVIFDSQ